MVTMWWRAARHVAAGGKALGLSRRAPPLETEEPLCQVGAMSVPEIAILRIELDEIEPVIWRRVAVDASTSLFGLHRIIQTTMGWLGYHRWEFDIDGVSYGVPDPEGH